MQRWIVVLGVAIIMVSGYLLFAPPSSFSVNTRISIASGSSLSEATQTLFEGHIVSHPNLLRYLLWLSGESDYIKSGVYTFSSPPNIFSVAYRLITGKFESPLIRLTFIEGVTTREETAQLQASVPFFSANDFTSAAQGQEGYLFPDTYFIQGGASAESIVTLMKKNFTIKITPLSKDIERSGHSLAEIVTMASLIEKEARTPEDRRIVSGILWRRIADNMPLQVDAVFGYINNRSTYSPSLQDLKSDSPYNTYTHRGLPPGPIDNPGIDSLEAATYPIQTPYLYYMSDKNGVMHFATTFKEHQANLQKYLN